MGVFALTAIIFCCACAHGVPILAPLHGLEALDVRQGEFIVGLRPGADHLDAATLSQAEVLQSFTIHTWTALMVKTDEVGLLRLRSDPNVEYVEANSYNVIAAEVHSLRGEPQDDYYQHQADSSGTNQCNSQTTTNYLWGLTRTSSRSRPNYSQGQYFYTETGFRVDVYVVDTGVNLGHQEFEGRASHGFTASDVRREGDSDLNGHGTHVAGSAAGRTFGVAKRANVIAVKVLDSNNRGTIRDFIEGVDWSVQHHRNKQQGSAPNKSVINLSLGAFSTSPTFDRSVEAAVAAGITVVVAAMNNNRDACGSSPAGVSVVITVAASSISDDLPSFTNYGPCVDIIAPGNDVISAFIGSSTATSRLSGTSMASPHVAGAVARYLSNFAPGSNPSPSQVRNFLLGNATPGVISMFPPKNTTPNYLLYYNC